MKVDLLTASAYVFSSYYLDLTVGTQLYSIAPSLLLSHQQQRSDAKCKYLSHCQFFIFVEGKALTSAEEHNAPLYKLFIY